MNLSLIAPTLATYFIVWWLVFLMVVPYKSAPPKILPKGHASSAPERPMLLSKVVITSILSIFITGWLVYFFQETDFLLTLRGY